MVNLCGESFVAEDMKTVVKVKQFSQTWPKTYYDQNML